MTDKQGIRDVLNLDVEPSSPTIILYSEQVSERLNYTCRFIFEHVLKMKFIITSGIEEFEASRFYKINYSPEILDGVLQIIPAGLLHQTGITNEKPPVFKVNNNICFYAGKEGDLKFDIFSAVFYMISRYEEWQDFEADKHGRFEITQSILFNNKVQLKPLVDEWIMELRKAIALYYPGIVLPVLKTKTISTIDIDNLNAYAGKGFVRTTGALMKDVLRCDFKNFSRRIKVLRGKEKDPFDIYSSFTKFCKDNNVAVFYFFLFRSGTPFDRTVETKSPAFKKAIDDVINNNGYVGIHPSYYSSEDEKQMRSEIKEFSKTLGMPVTLSRQHYLRFNIKKTPGMLMQNGIYTDFTMGFASSPGFRAGTSHPFYYYDFENEKETGLLFVPFCAMDGAYTVYDKKPPAEALQSLMKIKKEVEKVNGLFITVFHERTFAEHLFPGYGEMYKTLLK
ncbi:MAG: polysaccharide deacetylase family protein [Bacteroidia bacterium]